MLIDRIIGANILRLRAARGYSQAGFAEVLTGAGMSTKQRRVSRIECGETPLKLSEAVLVARVLKVTLSKLVSGIDR